MPDKVQPQLIGITLAFAFGGDFYGVYANNKLIDQDNGYLSRGVIEAIAEAFDLPFATLHVDEALGENSEEAEAEICGDGFPGTLTELRLMITEAQTPG